MAHHAEPMDIDSDFDNKENSLHHNNVLPFTEKGYEELDVSELNMKLRYSITPASSPMSKSYTANCLDNRNLELGDDSQNVTVNENSNLTRSLNSTMTNNDNILKSLKVFPLQALSTGQLVDKNRNTTVLRPLDSTASDDDANITVTVSGPCNIDENISLPSSSSSVVQTPDATTPTKDISKNDGGSPIMRGLKSVLNIFRSSQSPIPTADREDIVKAEILSPADASVSEEAKVQAMLASTPISAHRKKETTPTKRSSPRKDSIVFNEDLEKELQWKDETTIIFSQERVPIHKLFFNLPINENKITNEAVELPNQEIQDDMNSTVEYMDISCNNSFRDRTMTDMQVLGDKADGTFTGESDAEFLDCETTFTKNESLRNDKDKTPVADKTQNLNETKVNNMTPDMNVTKDMDLTKDIENANENKSGSRLKQIILNTTQDILDATLSITPEDLIPVAGQKSKDITGLVNSTELNVSSKDQTLEDLAKTIEFIDILATGTSPEELLKSQETLPALNKTVDVISSTQNMIQEENLNLTKTVEDHIQPLLNHTIDIVNSVINAIDEENADVINKVETNQDEFTVSASQPVPLGTGAGLLKPAPQTNLKTTSSSETIVDENIVIEDQIDEVTMRNNASNLISDLTLDIEVNKGTLDATHVIDDNTANSAKNSVSVISSPEAIHKPSHLSSKFVESSLVKEASMTELAADIPLPDEDDLEKEPKVPEVSQQDSPQETSSEPITLPLDIVDNINVTSEITEIINDESLKDTVFKLENTDNALPEIFTETFADSDNIPNETVPLKNDVIKNIEEVIENVDMRNNVEPMISKEARILNTVHNDLPEIALSLDIVAQKTEIKLDEVPEDRMNKYETLNTTVTGIEEVVNEDKKESVSELKPLPDIINQTITNQNNMDNNESEPVILEPSAPVSENSENISNEVPLPEIVPETMMKIGSELLSDTNVTKNCVVTNKLNAEQPKAPATGEVEKDSDINITGTSDTEGMLLKKDDVIDEQSSNVDVIPSQVSMSENENVPSDIDNVLVGECADIKTVCDEEIVLSENNSPFVSVTADDINTADKVVFTPPPSPPITSKGYNFNFDEIDDPFATKTKIKLSPPLDTPTKAVELKATTRCDEKSIPKREINNRRKSQPEGKKYVASKRKFNSTFSGADSEKTAVQPVEVLAAGDIKPRSPSNVALDPNNVMIDEDKLIQEARIVHEKTLNVTKEVLKSERDNKLEDNIEKSESDNKLESNAEKSEKIPIEFSEPADSETSLSKEIKPSSSSEQSTYYSAGTSSSESIPSRNVFNIPEIDDMNFNPFTTKSKIGQSPLPSLDIENPFATKSKIRSSPESSIIFPRSNDKIEVQEDITKTVSSYDKIESELLDQDAAGILSTINSSKGNDDRNATMSEINTEDEDTVEGPFLEAEDLQTDDKMSDFDGDNNDMMQFNDLPTQGSEENPDNGELFIDAEAFEFLLNQNKSNTIVDSGKESLFLKFDPLFAKRMSSITSDGMVAALSKIQKRQSTPTKASKPLQKDVTSPVAGPSNLNVTQDMDMNMSEEFNDDLNITVSKPMMVVPPAVNPVTPRNKSVTPNRSNRRSITFTSPAMAVIDRLLSLSGNSSLVHDTSMPQVSREQNEADLALTQLRELLAEKEVHVYNLRTESKELKDRLHSLESHLKSLENESQDRLKKINDLNIRLADKTKINKSMAAVVEEYERTIASLISETAQDKKKHAEERIKLINERDEQTAHLASMEVSFSDLHSKYEKSKQVILNCKANEEAYKKTIKEREENLIKLQNNYELLKQHATSKLNHANQELEKMNRSHEAEVLKLNAMIKRKELHITSLEESLAQKTKANEELTAICDELINKVG